MLPCSAKTSGVLLGRGEGIERGGSEPSIMRFATLHQTGDAKQCASGLLRVVSPAERAHGPPRGVEQHSASRGDLTEPEARRSIAPSSLAGRAEGEATAARQVLCARMGFWPFVRRPPSGVCETLVRGKLLTLLRDAV